MSVPLLEQLIEAFRVLPGVGQKTAQRMAYHVLEREREGGQRLAEALAAAIERIGHCVVIASTRFNPKISLPYFITAFVASKA